MKRSKRSGMHTRRYPYYFKYDAFDFMFQWILGMHTNGGSEVGEAFYAASQIEEGNAESWVAEWVKLAERIRQRAEEVYRKGHYVSARELYFRCYTYYRASLMFMSPLDRDTYWNRYEMARAMFQRAVDLEETVERITIMYDEIPTVGYMLKSISGGASQKLLIMIGGGDTFVEDLYYYIGPQGVARDYCVLLVDLPGQGILPDLGLSFHHDTSHYMKQILTQIDKNYNFIAVYGISAGGYLAPRATIGNEEIAACVACNALPDFSLVWKTTVTSKLAKLEEKRIYKMIEKFPKFMPVSHLLATYKWRFGVQSLKDLIQESEKFRFEPKDITCSSLNLIGESEYQAVQYRQGWEEFTSKGKGRHNKMVITPLDEGLDGHGLGTNISTMSQIVFDWLDECYEMERTR